MILARHPRTVGCEAVLRGVGRIPMPAPPELADALRCGPLAAAGAADSPPRVSTANPVSICGGTRKSSSFVGLRG